MHPIASPGGRRWEMIAAVLLLGVFVTFSVLRIVAPDSAQQDEKQIGIIEKRSFEQSGVATDDWPQWRGPQRDGVSFASIRTSWPEQGPPKLWEQPVGSGFASIVISKGKAIAFYLDDQDQETVDCFDAAKGTRLWRFRYPANYRNRFGDGPRATPTIDEDLVFTVGGTGMCHCLKMDPATPNGEAVWKKDLLSEFDAPNLQWGVSASPLVEGDLLVVTPGGPKGQSIVGLHKRSGDVLWKTLDDPAGYSSPVSANIGGEPQIVCFTGAALVGIQPLDGKELWRYPWPTEFKVNAATPIVVDDYVFFTSGYGQGCALLKLEKKTGGVWEPSLVYKHARFNCHFSSPVRVLDHVFGFHDSTLVCMDFRTGKIAWRKSGFGKGSVLSIGGVLGVLSDKGVFVLAEPATDEFKELARFEFSQERTWSMPTVAATRLYLRDEKKVACFDLSKRSD